MNINHVYECSIYQVIDKTFEGIPFRRKNSGLEYECVLNYSNYSKYKIIFIGKTLIYYDMIPNSLAIDLETGKNYKINCYLCSVGEYFVNLEKELIPVSNIINYKKENMSKRRILKKYKKSFNNDKCED